MVSDYFIPDTHYGNVELSQLGLSALSKCQKHDFFERKVRYYNFMAQSVTVIERNGMQWEFPSIPDVQRAYFVIQTDWKVHKSMHEAFFKWVKVERENESKFVRDLREIVSRYSPGVYEQHFTFRSEATISVEELQKHRNELYDQDHDVVVSLHHGMEAGPHPFSEFGRALVLLNENAARNEAECFTETIKIVDNTGTFGDRFINRNRCVYRIEARSDGTREEGVWVIRNKPFENTRLPSTVGWRRYSLEEADSVLELYKTYAEAEHCGDGETKRKQALLEQEERLVRAKNELNDQKMAHLEEQHKWEIERTRAQQELERLQAAFNEEMMRAKIELDRMRYFYERQTLDAKSSNERRKETSEWFKQLPVILGAVTVAYFAFRTASMQASKA